MAKRKKAKAKPKAAVQELQSNNSEWVSTTIAASMLGVHRRSIARLAQNEGVRQSTTKTSYGLENRFLRADIEKLAKQRRRKQPSQGDSDAIVNATVAAIVEKGDSQPNYAIVAQRELSGKLDALVEQQARLAAAQEEANRIARERLVWEMSQQQARSDPVARPGLRAAFTEFVRAITKKIR